MNAKIEVRLRIFYESLRSRLKRTLVQTRMKKESAKDLTTFLDDLRSELVSFHTRLGCKAQITS